VTRETIAMDVLQWDPPPPSTVRPGRPAARFGGGDEGPGQIARRARPPAPPRSCRSCVEPSRRAGAAARADHRAALARRHGPPTHRHRPHRARPATPASAWPCPRRPPSHGARARRGLAVAEPPVVARSGGRAGRYAPGDDRSVAATRPARPAVRQAAPARAPAPAPRGPHRGPGPDVLEKVWEKPESRPTATRRSRPEEPRQGPRQGKEALAPIFFEPSVHLVTSYRCLSSKSPSARCFARRKVCACARR
jgi:hypothetical protein